MQNVWFSEIRCMIPEVPAYGSVSSNCVGNPNSTLKHGVNCEFKCDNGFVISENHTITCSTDKGEWVPVHPTTIKCTG